MRRGILDLLVLSLSPLTSHRVVFGGWAGHACWLPTAVPLFSRAPGSSFISRCGVGLVAPVSAGCRSLRVFCAPSYFILLFREDTKGTPVCRYHPQIKVDRNVFQNAFRPHVRSYLLCVVPRSTLRLTVVRLRSGSADPDRQFDIILFYTWLDNFSLYVDYTMYRLYRPLLYAFFA